MTHQLQQGVNAPLFHIVDQNGEPVSFVNYRGRKVLLSFFRFSACALCNLRIHHFIKRFPEWQRQGLDVISLFESPMTNLQAHVGTQNAPFPLIADPMATVYNIYGVETSEEKVQATLSDISMKSNIAEVEAAGFKLTPEEGSNFHRIPAEFLIDEDGIVQHGNHAPV